MQPRVRLAFLAASAHCQLMLSFLSTSTAKSFSSGLLSIHSLPSLYLCLGLPQPMCLTLHVTMLNFMRFARAHLSSLSRSLWTISLPSSVSTAPHSLVLSAKLLRVHLIPLSMCHGLALAANKEPRSHSLTPPPPWGGQESWMKKPKLVDWNKDSLNEQ